MAVKLLIVLFVFFALSRVVLQFRAKKITTRGFLFWSIFWVGVAVATAYPDTLSRLALVVGVGRGVDVAIYAALLLVFYLLFRLFVRLERIEHDITTITTHIALHDDKREYRKP